MKCPFCNATLADNAPYCESCGTTIPFNASANASKPAVPLNSGRFQQRFPMRWFKFIIYFSLFFVAFVNLVNGIQLFTGSIYHGNAAEVYACFGNGLRTLDYIMALAQILLAIYAIYVRFQLSNYRKGAPHKYLAFLGVSIAIGLIYALAVSLITGLGELVGSVLLQNLPDIIVNVLLIFVNIVYFMKREELFSN